MMRKAAAVLTSVCCLVATQIYALGLGSISLESALNQPLRARIEILDLAGVSPAEITVQLASQQDFRRFDLERVDFLTDISFNIERTPEGVFVVLTSNRAVREPFLSFILDTRWPSGRILSEHTVLLDLPVFSDGRSTVEPINQPVSPNVGVQQGIVQREPAVSQPAVPITTTETPATATSDPEPAVEPPPEVAAGTEPLLEPEQPASSAAGSPGPVITEQPGLQDSLEVQEFDTLWEIALRVRPDSNVSVQQTMLAIQRLNPDAFVDGNINRLRAGSVLRVPDFSDIQSISQQQAVSEVVRQNQQASLDVEPLAAPASGPSSLVDSNQGQLRVLTVDDVEPAGSGISAVEAENAELDARIQALENQLALQEEDADRARLQQEELIARLDDLDQQIVAAMEIIRLQDQQLAQLQASLVTAAAQAAEQSAQQPVETEQAALAPAATQTTSPSFLDSLLRVLSNSTMLLIIVVVLVVLLMVMLLMRRNRAVTTEGFAEGFSPDVDSGDVEEEDILLHNRFRVPVEDDAALAEVAELANTAAIAEALDEEEIDELLTQEAELLDEEFPAEIAEAGPPDTGETAEESAQEVDFAFDQELEPEEDEEASGEVVDFELDEFLEEEVEEAADVPESIEFESGDAAEERLDASAQTEEATKETEETDAAEEDTGIDFDLGADEETETAAPVEDTDVEFGDDSGLPLDAEAELVAADTDAGDKIAAVTELQELSSDGSEAEEVLDFDLSDAGIEELEEEDMAVPESAASEDELESFDFDLTEEIDNAAEETGEAEDGSGPEADELGGIDFDLAEADVDAEVEAGEAESAEADAEPVVAIDFDLGEQIESEEAVQEPAASADDEELEESLERVNFELEEAVEDGDEEPESEAGAATDDTDAVIDFIAADDEPDSDIEIDLEGDEEEVGMDDEPASEDEVSSEADAELVEDEFAEMEFDAADQDEEAEDVVFDDVTAEEAEEAEDIEFTDEENEVESDDIAEVLAQDEEAASPEAELKLDDLDFLSADKDSMLDGADEDIDYLPDDDEAATKLDLAYAYQKMGDFDGAKEILEEVLKEGNDAQVNEAKHLIEALEK